jgi:hypothetical protein
VSWQIQIPFRSREDPLVDLADAARVLGQDDERIARQIVLSAITDGTAATAGELIDQLEKASRERRRKMLDDAREAVGLERSEDVDFAEHHRRVQLNASIRAANAPPSRLAYNEAGLIVDLAEVEQERRRAEVQEQRLRRQREEREAERAAEAAAMEAHDRAMRDRLTRENRQQLG